MFAKRLAIIAAIFAWFALVLPAAAQTVPVQGVDAPPVQKKMTTLDAVKAGKAILGSVLVERLKTRPEPYKVSGNTTLHVTFAVWNRDSDAIAVVEGDKTGTRLAITTEPKLPIKVDYSSQLESQYSLPSELNSEVVGIIYPVVTKKVISRKKSSYSATDLVYVPYSSDFYTPQMLAAGSDYLSFMIQGAYDELRAKGIKSRAFPDKLVADVVDPYLVKSIAVIEHSDTYSLTKQDDQDRAIGRFLVNLAANQEEAFHTSVSSAGAAGLVQFIPSTYAMMVRSRPDLGLIKDFRAGMADHKNAVKAQIAYIDSDLADMSVVRALYDTDRAKAAEYLAASYNGGSTRVIRAYTTFGDDWQKSYKAQLAAANSAQATLKSRIIALQKQVSKGKNVKTATLTIAKLRSERATAVSTVATLNRASLREETVGYVSKLKHAYAMFAAGYFATPNAPSGALPVVARSSAMSPTTVAVALASSSSQICFGDGTCVVPQ